MKNTKQPTYNKSDLIDFTRPNMWMNSVKNSRSETDKFTIIEIVIISLIILVALVVAHYMGWIEVVNNNGI